jgi:signal transduction histidine kinase
VATARRATLLVRASAVMMESGGPERAFARLGTLLVPRFAHWCTVDLAADGGFRRVAAVHLEPAGERFLVALALGGRTPPPVAEVVATGQPVVLWQPAGSADDSLRHAWWSLLQTPALLSVPLQARGSVLGTLTLGSARRFGRADMTLVMEVARRAALAAHTDRLRQEAEEAIRLRDEFLTVASHELNTPLAALTLAVTQLTDGARGNRQQTAALARLMERQARRLSLLVREMLEAAHFAAQDLSLSREPVDLARLVQHVIAQVGPDLERAGCAVELSLTPAMGVWDRERLELVLLSLLSNACKFGRGAPVSIRVTCTDRDARLAVTDHGAGIEPADRERLFSRFSRFGRATVGSGGHGLGLFMVRRIVEAHGGQVSVDSRPGAGSTFLVDLPRGRHPVP